MNRLRSAVEIERVRREGRSYAHPLVVLIAAPALPEQAQGRRAAVVAGRRAAVVAGSRAAVVAGRRIGGAVIRNRAKRLLREALRQEQVKPGWDLMLVARAAIVGARLVQVKAALHQLLQRSELAMS